MDFHEDFKLFLVTRNPDPALPPDAASLVTIVNFTTTRSGLEGQLLGLTIKNEKPELEATKSKLLLEEEDQKVQMASLEKQLLEELANSAGNILENKALIDSLNETKTKSAIIQESLKKAHELQINLDQEREVYRRIAAAGSSLYFTIMDLVKINNMYQFSLPVFLKLFQRALRKGEKGIFLPFFSIDLFLDTVSAVDQRISQVCEKLQKLVLEYAARSLFKADRLMFALHMVYIMFPKSFGEQEWEVFVGKVVATDKNAGDLPGWAHPSRKAAFSLLASTLATFVQGCNLKDAESWSMKVIKKNTN